MHNLIPESGCKVNHIFEAPSNPLLDGAKPPNSGDPPAAGTGPISPLHAAALAYATMGIRVFPIAPLTKKQPLTPHGFLDASADPTQVDAWWFAHPDANIGWAPAASGLVIVDVDRHGGADGFASLAALETAAGASLPPTRTVATANGGEHRIFGGTLRNATAYGGAAGIDIRGGEVVNGKIVHGGYGLLPPSQITRDDGTIGEYAWKSEAATAELPEWFAGLQPAERAEPEAVAAENVLPDHPENVQHAQHRLAQMVAAGEIAREGVDGNARMFQAAGHCKNAGVTKDRAVNLLWQEYNPHCEPPWDDPEDDTFRAPIVSAYGNEKIPFGRTGDTFVSDADALGGVKQPGTDRPLFSSGKAQRLRDPKPVIDLIPGLVEKHRVAYLSGPGDLHKSRLAQQWGACIHTGTPIFGRPVERATFVHISYENGEDEDARRQATLIRRLELDPLALDGHVYCDWRGRGPLLRVADELTPTALWQELEKFLRAIGGHKFVVFDSQYNVFSMKDTVRFDESAARNAVEWLDLQMAALDATGLMLTHPSYAGVERGDNSGGSPAWVNAPRVRLAVKPVKNLPSSVELSLVKRNNVVKGQPLTLHVVDGLLVSDDQNAQEQALYRACVETARGAANGGIPLHKGSRGIPTSACLQVETVCGIRPTPRDLREQLDLAVMRHDLIYRVYDKNKRGAEATAGYFPVEKLPF